MLPTPLRNLWYVGLPLLVTSLAYSALAQGSRPPVAQVRNHFERAQAALRANDSAAAEKEFRDVLALDHKNPGAHAGIGVIEMGRGNCQAASKEFHSALAVQPSFSRGLALLGICEKRLGAPSARSSLQNAFEKLTEKPLRVQVGMELAGLYEQQGDMEATASLMRQLVQLAPENPDVLFAAQRIYSDLAEETLNKLAVVAPGSARMQQAIAEKLINAGDLKGAIAHYRKALQIDPRTPGVHFELGEAILEATPSDAAQAEAQKELETAIAMDGDTSLTECALAEISSWRSEPDRALAHYQRAYQLNPNEVQAQMGMAQLLMEKKPQEAIKYLRMAVQADPLNGQAHYRLASAYQRFGMKERAQVEWQLSQEISKTKAQVEALYHEMNRRPKRESFEVPDKENSQGNQ
jgi:Tfp pilus assembly protein PilF